jgi:hypothetical protein
MEIPLIALGWILALNIVLLFFFSKAFFLASSRLGWLMLLSNYRVRSHRAAAAGSPTGLGLHKLAYIFHN